MTLKASKSKRFGKSSTLSSTSTLLLGCNAREKTMQKMSSAVGVSFDCLRVDTESRGTAPPEPKDGLAPGASPKAKPAKPARKPFAPAAQEVMTRPQSSQRFLATAYDSDWRLRPKSPQAHRAAEVPELGEDLRNWLSGVLGKRKKPVLLGNIKRLDLASSLLPEAPACEWDPLHDLRVRGPQESEPSSARTSLSSGADTEMGATGIWARLGRRTSMSLRLGRRRSSARPGPPKEEVVVAAPPPQKVTLQKVCQEHCIPSQISAQAFSWFYRYADTGLSVRDKLELTEASVLNGRPFELSSLGSMSREALYKTCCAISDVEDPVQLDMEFVGGALKAVDANGNDSLELVEFLDFYHRYCFSEEVLLSRQERELRQLARKYGFSFLELDQLKIKFDKADRNRSGKLGYEELLSLMALLTNLPAGQELPEKKKKEWWISARQGWRRYLDLDAFLSFYVSIAD